MHPSNATNSAHSTYPFGSNSESSNSQLKRRHEDTLSEMIRSSTTEEKRLKIKLPSNPLATLNKMPDNILERIYNWAETSSLQYPSKEIKSRSNMFDYTLTDNYKELLKKANKTPEEHSIIKVGINNGEITSLETCLGYLKNRFPDSQAIENFNKFKDSNLTLERFFSFEKKIMSLMNSNLMSVWFRIQIDLLYEGIEIPSLKTAEEVRSYLLDKNNEETLSNVHRLVLSDLNLVAVPNEILSLTGLQSLFLNNNNIKFIPPEIGSMRSLTRLDLGHNQIQAIPPEIGSMRSLTRLDLEHNQIQAIPPEIGSMRSLIELNLERNQISEIPSEILELTNLEILIFSSNDILEIPQKIGSLKKLKSALFGNNKISEIPAGIAMLDKLDILDLSRNQISLVPEEITMMHKLDTLVLSHNNITLIPRGIKAMTWLNNLEYGNNPGQ